MIFYNEEGKKVYLKVKDRINGDASGMYGDVYKLTSETCIKTFKKENVSSDFDLEAFQFIRSLNLTNFYDVYELLYNKKQKLKAYIMKYYPKAQIDILTMPTSYTLDNLVNLRNSIMSLTSNNIRVEDLHTGNVILGSNEMTVIDTDLYHFNHVLDSSELAQKNMNFLISLFGELYLEALNKYHRGEKNSYLFRYLIEDLFIYYNADEICKKLKKHKYPIDYFRSK